jgi:galactokinase/mevalonate kinase-like predicted kinase
MADRVSQLIGAFVSLYERDNGMTGAAGSRTEASIDSLFCSIADGSYILSESRESDFFENAGISELLVASEKLYGIYRHTGNNYTKILTALLLYRVFSYYLPNQKSLINLGCVPYAAIARIEEREFELALEHFKDDIINPAEANEAVLKAIGIAFYERAFQLLEDQVQDCIRNRKPQLFQKFDLSLYPLRVEEHQQWRREVVKVPVRIELTSCVGSDIFLLSMMRPDKARCINISVDLFNADAAGFQSPIEVICRPIKEQGIRLTSQDLGVSKMITSLDDLFDMRNDDLSLLKAAVIASGIIPPSAKNSGADLNGVLKILLSKLDGYSGFEIITMVVQIPRGSGLAVSTNLLSGMIYSLMRFSGQCAGKITDAQKADVAVRAIYGEWLGGSGGGSQDYGGMWGGFKEILGTEPNAEYEPYSNGGFLSEYKEMSLSEEAIEAVLDSMILVNGGTGQNVGPILKMITAQFMVKNDLASRARSKTEMNYDLIRKALQEGDARLLGALESADFINRVDISPLANNKYHQLVYEQLQREFKDDLWGYDSTGGRAGAGGVLWVDPKCKQQVSARFLSISQSVQHELKGQMHFAAPPMVYDFRLNKRGMTVESIREKQIEERLTRRDKISTRNVGHISVDDIKATYGFNEAMFTRIQKAYQKGELSISKNIDPQIKHGDIVLPETMLQQIPFPGSPQYENLFRAGTDVLREEPIAYITLNGGESTRYGTNVIRSLNPSIFIAGNYCSPIELKMAHFRYLRETFQINVHPVFANGYFTEKNTRRVLEANDHFGVDPLVVHHCQHEVVHRVVPTIKDLEFWFDHIREKSRSTKEEELAHQYNRAMINWIRQEGEGSVYHAKGKNKLNTLVSPGHYFSFMSIVTNGVLGKLIRQGVKNLVVSSNDNLMSTLDPAIFFHHIKHNNGATSEVVPKLFDRGGAPIVVNGSVEIYEDFRFPDMETLARVPYFNPITSWLKVEKILNVLGLEQDDVIGASEGSEVLQARCRKAVYDLGEKLRTYPVLKYINEDMGNGITYTFPVIQFEKLFGDFISTLSPEFLLVPKLMRHTQIKSVDHIYQVYNDKSLDILEALIDTKQMYMNNNEPSIV